MPDKRTIAAFNVVVVEDCDDTGTLLETYLRDELPRLVYGDPRGGTKNPATRVRFAHSDGEPALGQLAHMRPVVNAMERCVADTGDDLKRALPMVGHFPLEDPLRELINTALPLEPTGGPGMESASGFLEIRRQIASYLEPDILIVDLALSEADKKALLDKGGGNDWLTDEEIATPPHRQLDDPRPALRTLTGFKVMRAFARSIPVIVTSYWRNPLVAQHCLVNGAFSFVRKPIPSELMSRATHKITAPVLDLSAKKNENPLDVLVVHYLTTMSNEVLKALGSVWLAQEESR